MQIALHHNQKHCKLCVDCVFFRMKQNDIAAMTIGSFASETL